MSVPVRITEEPDGRLCMESPYDAGFVADFKAELPSSFREWDPQRKRWLVSALAEAALLTFLRGRGCPITDTRQKQALTRDPYETMPAELKDAFEALYLAPQAPLLVAEASYRALARVFHPDNQEYGNIRTMEGINDAIRTIRKYLAETPE